jgi:hypothetical protein
MAALVRHWHTLPERNCLAQFNHHGQAMSFSEGCDDTANAKSSRLVTDDRRKHGY